MWKFIQENFALFPLPCHQLKKSIKKIFQWGGGSIRGWGKHKAQGVIKIKVNKQNIII